MTKFALNNFRDGAPRSWEIRKAQQQVLAQSRKNAFADRLFDDFLSSRGVTDPYKDCALPLKRKAPAESRIDALTLHVCRKIDFYTADEDEVTVEETRVVEEAEVFTELKLSHNYAYRQTLLKPSTQSPNPKKAGKKQKKTGKKAKQYSEENGGGIAIDSKENWDDLKESLTMKKKELGKAAAFPSF